MRDARGTISARIGLLVASTVFALGVAEVVARGFVPMPKLTAMGSHLVVPDPARGFKLAPNAKVFVTDGYFQMHVETNEHGLRDSIDPTLPNPGYIAIGDST